MQVKNQWVYISTIILIAAALLVGNRFDARFAGGDGYENHQVAMSQNTIWQRGEIVSDAEFVTFGPATIWLDTGTEIKLIDGRDGKETIQLIQGRIYIEGEVDVTVRELTMEAQERMSLVHYSWLDEIDIIFLDDFSTVLTPKFSLVPHEVATNMIKINTLTYDYEEYDFTPENSSAKDFYETVLD